MASTARIVVLAKDLRAFHAWCRETGHSPRDRRITFAAGPSALRVSADARIVRYGDWTDRPDGRALKEALAKQRVPSPALAA
jgi:hypothetical protein